MSNHNSSPAISVLMPTYNAAPYLREAIDSILGQSFTDFEFLIINDGSTDKSEEIIWSYTDPRIRYVKNDENLKLIATLNKGIALCKGKYIARMDADDISLPNRLERQYNFMEQHLDVGICGTFYESFAENTTFNACRYPENHEDICFKQLYQIQVSHGTVLMRKQMLEKHKLTFDANYPHAEDYDFFTRASRVTLLHNLQFIGYKVRHHEEEVSKKYRLEQIANSNIIRHREFELLGYPISDMLLNDYTQLSHQNYTGIQSSVNDIKSMLEGILSGNKKTKTFDQDFLLKQLREMWFHYCYHIGQPKDYLKSSSLSNKSRIGFLTKLKWRIKSVFRQ